MAADKSATLLAEINRRGFAINVSAVQNELTVILKDAKNHKVAEQVCPLEGLDDVLKAMVGTINGTGGVAPTPDAVRFVDYLNRIGISPKFASLTAAGDVAVRTMKDETGPAVFRQRAAAERHAKSTGAAAVWNVTSGEVVTV